MPALSLDSLNDRPELVQLNVITYTTGVQLDPYRDLQNQILCIHCDGREDAHVFNPGKAPAGRAGTAEGKDVLAVPGGGSRRHERQRHAQLSVNLGTLRLVLPESCVQWHQSCDFAHRVHRASGSESDFAPAQRWLSTILVVPMDRT